MEVGPGVHRVEWPFANRLACCYVLHGDRTLVVDAGIATTPSQSLVPYLAELGLGPDAITYVLFSHADADHTGGAAALRQMSPRATYLCHRLDRAMVEDVERLITDRYGDFGGEHGLPDSEETTAWYREVAQHVPVDIALCGGERIRLSADWEVEILHTPGHSRGHVTVLDRRSKLAIICDAALSDGVPSATGDPAMPPTYRYVETYTASLQRLSELPFELLLTSHYPIMDRERGLDFLAASRAYVDRVQEVLEEELRRADAAPTTPMLVERCAPRLGAWPEETRKLLVWPLVGHIEAMLADGRLRRAPRDNGLSRWEMVT